MRLSQISITVFVLGSLVVYVVHSRQRDLLPRLFVTPPRQDLGTVTPGDNFLIQFTLKNKGSRPLHIWDLQTSCGCAPAKLSNAVIGEGSSETLSIAYRVPAKPGHFGHAVTFRTNDPQNTQSVLQFEGQAQWAVDANPTQIHLGVVANNKSVSREIELFSVENVPFSVKAVQASAPWISVTALKNGEDRRHRFRITTKEVDLEGTFAESISFSATAKKRPTIVVPISAELVGLQVVSPRALLLPASSPGSLVKATLVVTSPTGGQTDGAFASVAIQDQDWEVAQWTWDRVSEGTGALSVMIRVPSEPGYRRSQLAVQLRGDKIIVIPVTCLVAVGTAQVHPPSPSVP